MGFRERALEGVGLNHSFWSERRVLITGHTGFKGSWLTSWLSTAGARLTGLALPPDTNPNLFEAAGIGALIDSRIGDIRDRAAVTRVFADSLPEIVFHLAAQPLVRRSYSEPVETFATNVLGTAHVLDSARATKSVRAIVVITTDKAYRDRVDSRPHVETDELGGHDPYAASKACAELVAASFRDSFFRRENVGLATARAGNVIGGGDWSADRIFPDIVTACDADSALVLRRPDAIRPWQHVLDPLHGYIMLAERLFAEPEKFSDAWNFGPDEESTKSVLDLANEAIRTWRRGTITVAPGQGPHETGVLRLDSTKSRRQLGWKPRLQFEEAVQWTVDWYQRLSRDGARTLTGSQIAAFEERSR